ncbi:MAG: Phospholipase C [Cytophagales bacterium]|jgi:phospholipase C|nr:phospholipase C, phosphocholine-specific [Bacteroidota bacterium]MBS1982250.1 phospholipase C, phosphocholine-specific [Bacteroidota bacterium]WHZ09013.1 MAG: Phospholipase C [Cytophagales bacterium]
MDTRREFIKKTILFSGGAAISTLYPSIVQAYQINPSPGTTWRDAEHIVILMQENRSFDHCFGSLRGVRGFNDPRAFFLPNKNPVWLQTNKKGETFAPFRLNIKDTNATWMGSLPHTWADQTDARNGGRHDQWLNVKKSGNRDYRNIPLTMGYYTREDIPFHYALADAFTVCDQNFCSSLTGTTPNRLYLWTGKIRESAQAQARVRNEETDYNSEAAWKTFPERLEENGISWKIYQNEISVGVGFEGDEEPWLANFGDNPIEMFEQYQVRFHPAYIKQLPVTIDQLKKTIAAEKAALTRLDKGKKYTELNRHIASSERELNKLLIFQKKYTLENYSKLSEEQKHLHEKAFTTNVSDPDYRTLASLRYTDNGTERVMNIPKGDVLFQFREDVTNKKLPTVSWLVAPENFSDHPSAPWYGAWYLSEVLDILTQNPEVWKKTIFILCYDENDGYFDHVPPFVSPVPGDQLSGTVSGGIDTLTEYVRLEDDLKRKMASHARGGPIGLGYRVPLVIASPWSRGGAVCSQVFDHTSILQFLEKFLSQKTGKKITEPNISTWRRTVCGDLTSTFVPYQGELLKLPEFLLHDEFVESIHQAQFKKNPSGYHALSDHEIALVNQSQSSSVLPRQESGNRLARPLPYELYANGKVTDQLEFQITLESRNEIWKNEAAGSPFLMYCYNPVFLQRAYAVSPGDKITDGWTQKFMNDSNYHFFVYGPNGFFRKFKGKANNHPIEIICQYEKNNNQFTGTLELVINNTSDRIITIDLSDNSYQQAKQTKEIAPRSSAVMKSNLKSSSGWYDVSVKIPTDTTFEYRYAGHIETGNESISDPAMAI